MEPSSSPRSVTDRSPTERHARHRRQGRREEGRQLSGDIELGQIAGIPLAMHWSVLIVAWLLTWSLATRSFPHHAAGHTQLTYWLAGIGAATAFFWVASRARDGPRTGRTPTCSGGHRAHTLVVRGCRAWPRTIHPTRRPADRSGRSGHEPGTRRRVRSAGSQFRVDQHLACRRGCCRMAGRHQSHAGRLQLDPWGATRRRPDTSSGDVATTRLDVLSRSCSSVPERWSSSSERAWEGCGSS